MRLSPATQEIQAFLHATPSKPTKMNASQSRRSARLASKPTPKYFDENDLISDAIEEYCAQFDWEFSDNFVTKFNAWLPTADKYELEKYDYKTNTYVPRTTIEAAKYWTRYVCKSTLKQQKIQKLTRAIANYCKKRGYEYNPLMDQKFTQWMADPANKKLITYTSNSSCNCSGCTSGTKNQAGAYTYNRTTTYCLNKWFSTLNKIVVF